MADHAGVVRIDGGGGHLYWEIDFLAMKATRWTELPSHEWEKQQFQLRRSSGAWEIKLQPRAAWWRFDDEVANELETLWQRFTSN